MKAGGIRKAIAGIPGALSLRAKIMGVVVALTLLLGSAASVQMRTSQEAVLGEELAKRGASIAADLAGRGADYILTGNSFALHDLVRNTYQNNEDVRYVFVLDQKGNVLAHSFSGGMPAGLSEAHPTVSRTLPHIEVFRTEEGLVRDVALPILEGRAGTARVGMSDLRLQSTIASLTRQLLAATASTSLVGLVFALLLTAFLTRPIRQLAEVAEAVTAGDFERKAPVWGQDEIGQLAMAFNSMTAHLSQYNERLLRRNRELAALNAISSAASGLLSQEEMLSASLRQLIEILDMRAGVVLLEEPQSRNLVMAAVVGPPPVLAAAQACRIEEGCPCLTVFKSSRLRVVVNVLSSCMWIRQSNIVSSDLNAGVCVPLTSKGVCLGVLFVAGAQRRSIGEEQMAILRSIGHQIGVAADNARLWEELRQREALRTHLLEKLIAAQEEERRRIARELHDETAQGLAALIMSLEAAENEVPADLWKLKGKLARTRAFASYTLDETRRLVQDLRPAVLDTLGLVPAVRWYTEDRLEQSDVAVTIEANGLPGRLPPLVETTVFRIIQEATNNVAKHANARSMAIEIQKVASSVTVLASDDGRGFDTRHLLASASLGSVNMGLLGMRERVVLLGGSMDIDSSPGHGTRLRIHIPFQEN